MPSCCAAVGEDAVSATSCSRCGHHGRTVDPITLKALLTPAALPRFSAESYRFCPTPDCEIVYFGPQTIFVLEDLALPVFQKQRPGERTVCYCFAVTEKQLRSEMADSGTSESAARIADLVKAGRCACEVRNPQGSCCLGNVTALLTSFQNELASSRG